MPWHSFWCTACAGMRMVPSGLSLCSASSPFYRTVFCCMCGVLLGAVSFLWCCVCRSGPLGCVAVVCFLQTRLLHALGVVVCVFFTHMQYYCGHTTDIRCV